MASVRKLAGLGWGKLLRSTVREAFSDDIVNRSAALSFWFLLGFFPLLFAVAGMLSMIGSGPGSQGILLRYLAHVLPDTASGLVRQVLSHTTGSAIGFSLLFALWTASSATAGLMDALNGIYELKEARPWWKAQLVSVALAVATVALMVIAVLLVVYVPIVLHTIAPGSALVVLWKIVQWPAAAILLILALLCLYRFAPNIHDQKWKWLVPGSIVAIGIWVGVSVGFKVYIRHFSNYGLLYGSLGTLIILMFWFYLSGAAILIGGEINSILEDAAARRNVPGAKKRGQRSSLDSSAQASAPK